MEFSCVLTFFDDLPLTASVGTGVEDALWNPFEAIRQGPGTDGRPIADGRSPNLRPKMRPGSGRAEETTGLLSARLVTGQTATWRGCAVRATTKHFASPSDCCSGQNEVCAVQETSRLLDGQ